jgi:hypothetical protein
MAGFEEGRAEGGRAEGGQGRGGEGEGEGERGEGIMNYQKKVFVISRPRTRRPLLCRLS